MNHVDVGDEPCCVLTHGDCIAVMRGMDDNSVDMVLTDIPYGEVNRAAEGQGGLRDINKGVADDVTVDLETMVAQLDRICSGSIYIFCGMEQVSDLRRLFREKGLTTRVCVWEKTNPSPMNGTRLWLSGVEFCVFARKPNAVFNEHCKNPVWRFPRGRRKTHPTEKPLALFKYLVKVSTSEGQTVLDCCMGSGTAGVAAVELGRKFIGIELFEEYFNGAKARIEEAHANAAAVLAA